MTLHYSARKAKERNNRKQELQTQIKVILEMYNTYHLRIYSDMLSDLQIEQEEIRKYELNGLLVRSECTWIEDGEKPTKYFLGLETRNYVNNNISRLINSQGELINKQDQILEDIANFYKSLYSNKDKLLNDVNLNDIIHESEIKKVSPEAKKKLELDITKQEILETLKKLKNNTIVNHQEQMTLQLRFSNSFGMILAH